MCKQTELIQRYYCINEGNDVMYIPPACFLHTK